jgi:hypothetical protein
VNVWIDAPDEMSAGGNFSAWVNVSNVSNMGAADYDIIYDPDVLEVTNIPYAGGVIGGSPFPVDMWTLSPPGVQGRVRIINNAPGSSSVSGSGYMARVYFHVVGSPCNYSTIQPTPGPFSGGLFDSSTNNIPANWISDSVHVGN